jgi:transposase
VGATKRGKGTKWMVVVDGQGLPLGSQLTSASPAEVTLAEATLDAIVASRQPERVIADKAYDSDPLRQTLHERGMELICPHRANRTRAKTQDGRKLRRYRRRWRIERTFAWLGNFRRLVIRYERHAFMYAAFFHLACCLILVRWL